MPARTRLAVLFIAACLFAIGLLMVASQDAHARPPVPPAVFTAVRTYWLTRAERVAAFNVVACETGGTYSVWARNGGYLGLFQMSAWARARYGHGTTARAQARAAHNYYVDSGRDWSPWTCSSW